MLLYASLDISTDLFVIFLLGNYLPRSEEGSDVTVAAGGNLSKGASGEVDLRCAARVTYCGQVATCFVLLMSIIIV